MPNCIGNSLCALIWLLIIVSLEVFSRLCHEHLPEVHAHLESLQILTMLSVSWFLTLFITVMDHNAATGIIDCFFVDGSKVRYIAAVYIVRKHTTVTVLKHL